MTLHIRKARLDDLDALVAIENSVFAGDRLSRRSLRHAVVAPTCAMIAAESDGKLVGYALAHFHKNAGVARLFSIAAAHGAPRGVGRALLGACLEQTVRRKRRALRLEVREDNVRAIALYEQAGFARFGRYEDYYEDGAAALRFEKAV